MTNSLVVGLGQIGTAVTAVISNYDKFVDTYDPALDHTPSLTTVDVLHICFPYSEHFVSDAKDYIKTYKPWHVVVWSTAPIGTTARIKGAVHSPVEGRHPKLALSIRSMTRWVGGQDHAEVDYFVTSYFKKMNLNTRGVYDSAFTEFLKLRSTAKYGVNLAWTDYEAMVAKELGMDFKLVKDFDRDYNKLYHNLDMDWAQRYILDPPNGKISGHCVVPNAELLDEQFPNDMLKMIKEYK